ncbi:MAG: serine/threonine-protein kinase [Mycobacterium sp.]
MPMADGSRFAGYIIVRCLGAGGMGEVYVAQHPRLPRQDALKVLRTEVSADRDYRERFLREADLVATLSHPNIVGVYDRGEDHGQLWISMDYVDGLDAGQLLRRETRGRMLPAQVAQIVTAVADALDYAHHRNLLHRDVKPANILIGGDRPGDKRIMLADFGIARRADESNGLTATNMTIGTVSYAAPEQLTGIALDGRADQYALAATAFHLLTGSPPFVDPNPAVVIGQHLTAPPPSLGLPELASADPVLTKALAKNPGDRFDRCADFARALAHQLGPAGADATRLSPTGTALMSPDAEPTALLGGTRSRRSLLVPAVMIVLLAAVIVLAVMAFDHPKHKRPAPSAPAHSTTSQVLPPASVPAPAPVPPTTTEPPSTTQPAPPAPSAPAPTSSPVPTTTAETTEQPQPEEESPIRECMQQTGQTRLQCWEEIRRSRRR